MERGATDSDGTWNPEAAIVASEERVTERPRDRETERQRDRETERRRDRETKRQRHCFATPKQ